MANLPKLSDLSLMEEGQLQAEFTFNDFAVVVDALLGVPKLLSFQTTTPPVSPVTGGVYLTADTGCTGAWVGQESSFAC